MTTRSSYPPPSEPRAAVITHDSARGVGRIERCCGPTYVVMRTTLVPALGEHVRLTFGGVAGELRLAAIVRWHERGALGLDVSACSSADLRSLRRRIGVPVSIFLQDDEVEGLAIQVEEAEVTIHTSAQLPRGLRVSVRIYEDEHFGEWHDRAMVVGRTHHGVVQLETQRSRWSEAPSSAS